MNKLFARPKVTTIAAGGLGQKFTVFESGDTKIGRIPDPRT